MRLHRVIPLGQRCNTTELEESSKDPDSLGALWKVCDRWWEEVSLLGIKRGVALTDVKIIWRRSLNRTFCVDVSV